MPTNMLRLRDDPAWVEGVTAWVESILAMRNSALVAVPAEVRVLPWAAVYRFPTTEGDLFFKACAPSQAFEPALMRYLAQHRPDDVLPVLAADLERAWMLLPDGGPLLRFTLTGQPDDLVRHWSAVLPQVAAMQRDLAGDARRLLSLGVLDRRASVLPTLYRELLDNTHLWPIDHPDGLSSDDLPRLRAFAPRLDDLCAELSDLGPADTLVHDDFHDGHIFTRPTPGGYHYRFFDFGDGCIGHPFFQMIAPQRFYARAYDELELDDASVESLYEVYLNGWADHAPLPALRRTLDIALAAGALMRALTWVHAFGPHRDDSPPDIYNIYAWGMAHWLHELEERSRRLG